MRDCLARHAACLREFSSIVNRKRNKPDSELFSRRCGRLKSLRMRLKRQKGSYSPFSDSAELAKHLNSFGLQGALRLQLASFAYDTGLRPSMFFMTAHIGSYLQALASCDLSRECLCENLAHLLLMTLNCAWANPKSCKAALGEAAVALLPTDEITEQKCFLHLTA